MNWLIDGDTVKFPARRRRATASGGLAVPLALEPSPTTLLDQARAGLASLAYTDQTEPQKRPLSCPYSSGRVILELYSGAVYPDRCRSQGCDFCLPLNARRRCLAITYAAPQRMIRLSLVAGKLDGSPCAVARTRVGLISRNLKRQGLSPGEWTWTIEKNPKETGYHAHCLQRGPSIPQDELQNACVKARAGWPDIRAIRRKGIWTSRYGMKGFGADGYGLKGFRANADTKEALRINHGKLEHHSTGFFAIEGETLRVRDMERAAIAEMNLGKRVAYLACASDQVDWLLSCRERRDSFIRDLNHRSVKKLRAFA